MHISDRTSSLEESFLNKWDSTVKYKILAGEDIIQFNLGQPGFACPDFVVKIIEEVNKRGKNNFYNHTAGTDGARQAAALFQKNMFGVEYDKDEIIITNGAKEALFLAFSAILNRGDEAVVIAPCWPSYIQQIKLAGAEPVIVDADEKFHLDIDAIKDAITQRTKVLVINNPNNPTGAVYEEEELLQISKLAADNDLIVISDEVYGTTVFDSKEHISIASLSGMKERSVVVDGFSKTLSMAGYRLGYAAASKEIISAMVKIKSNINGNTNSFFQTVIEKAVLEHFIELKTFVEFAGKEYEARRDFVCKKLLEMGIEFEKPEGTFYVFAKIPENYKGSSGEFAQYLLENAKVAVAPGKFFGDKYDRYFRISFGANMEEVEEGIGRVEKTIKSAI